MVLPFGLGPDGNNLDAIHNADFVPTAPVLEQKSASTSTPTAPLPPSMQYSRGQTNIYTGVPVIVNPYIEFIVVNGDDRYMIRCERRLILERSVELAKLIHAGPNSGRKGDNHFQVLNVDKFDFELMIRFMETNFVHYRDHKHLLKLVELADRFGVPDMLIHCIRELDLNISSSTVVDIFRAFWFYQGLAPFNLQHPVITSYEGLKKVTKNVKKSKKHTTSKQQEDVVTQEPINSNEQRIPSSVPFTTEDYGIALLKNALQLIDMQAESILAKEQISDLRFEELETIVKRNTLQLRSEVTLFDCLADWSLSECKRRSIDVSDENRQRVLGPLCCTPRYLRMTATEFRRCCDRVELLHRTEIQLIIESLEGKKPKNLTRSQSELFDKFRQKRAEYPELPIHLSDRSHPKNYPKRMRQLHDGRPEEGCFEKIGMNCLRIFVCIFD